MNPHVSWRFLVPMVAISLLIGTVTATAQDYAVAEPGTMTLQLDQAITMALDQSPAVQGVTYKSQSAAEKAKAAGRSRWGHLDAVASADRYEGARVLMPLSRELINGGLPNAPFDRNQIHYGLTYEIPLYLGGKLSASIEIAKIEAAKADALRDGTRWQIRYNVVSLYSGVQTLDDALKASSALIHTLEAVQTRLQLMVDNGKRPELDLLKVNDEMAEARANHAALQAQRTKVAGLLLALLGQDPSLALTITPLAEVDPVLTVPVDSLQAMALNSSPVKQAILTSRQAGSGVKSARGGFMPSVVGQANYFRHHAGSVDDDPTTWQLTLGVKLPLFNGTSRFAALSAAKAGQRAADESVKLARLRSQADLNYALARLDAARTGLTAAQARVASAGEAARSEQIRYDSGASSIEDLLRARTREEAAHTALAQATGEVKIAAEQINAVVEMEVIQ